MRKLLAVLLLCIVLLAGCGSGSTPATDPNQNLVPIQNQQQQQPYYDPYSGGGYDTSQYNYQQTQGYDPYANLPAGRYLVGQDQAATLLGSIQDQSGVCQRALKNTYSPFYRSSVIICDWDPNQGVCNVVGTATSVQLCGY
jgi:hypothetical protein